MGQRVAKTFAVGMVLLFGTAFLPGCSGGDVTAGAAVAVDEAPSDSKASVPAPANEDSAPSPQELVKQFVQAEPGRLNDALNAVAAQKDAAVVPLLENLTEKDAERVLQAIERIEVQRHSSAKGDAAIWESSPLVTCLGHDSEDVRRAAMTALQVLYPKLPDRMGLIRALRDARQGSVHWDVISLLPDVLESFAMVELREITALPVGKAGKDPAVPHEERLVAIGEPARLPIRHSIAVLDPTSKVSTKEFDLQMRRQAREERWRRRKATNRFYIPPPDEAFQNETKELEALQADADRKYAIIDGLTATLETLWRKRNLEFMAEAQPLAPDPDNVKAEHARNDAAVADILMEGGETLLAKWGQHPKAARLFYDAMLITRGANVARPRDIVYRNASDLALAMEWLDLDFAQQSQQAVLDQFETAIAEGGDDHKALQAFLPFVVSRLAGCAWRRSDLPLALTMQRRSVELYEQSFGLNFVDTGVEVCRLAAVQAETGDRDEAIQTYRRSIEIHKALRPQSDTRLVDAVSGLCVLLIRVDRAAEAQELVLQYLNDFRQSPGENHLQTVRLVSEQGRCLLALDKPEEAEETTRGALAKMKSLNKGESLPAGNAYEILGEILWARGKREEARSQWQTSLRIRTTWFGDRHPATRRVAARLEETKQP